MTRRENPKWRLHFEVREDVCFARGAAIEQDPLAVSKRLQEQHHHRLLSSLLGRGACSCFFPQRHAPNSSIPFMLFSPVWCRSLTSSSTGWGCQLPDGALNPELCSCTPTDLQMLPSFLTAVDLRCLTYLTPAALCISAVPQEPTNVWGQGLCCSLAWFFNSVKCKSDVEGQLQHLFPHAGLAWLLF